MESHKTSRLARVVLLALVSLSCGASLSVFAQNTYQVSPSWGSNTNDWADIGSFANTGVSQYVIFTVRGHWCGSIISAQFRYDDIAYTGSSTNWMELAPSNGGKVYNATQPVAIDIRRASPSTTSDPILARVRNLHTMCGGTSLNIHIETSTTFTSSNGTGSSGSVDSGYAASDVGWKFPVTTDAHAASTSGLFILNSGNVGIGTTDPVARLHVKTNTDENLWIRSASGLDMTAGKDDQSNFVKLNINASPLIINQGSGGNVGIGTTSPAERLAISNASGSDAFLLVTGGPGLTRGGVKLGNGGNTYGQLYFDNSSNNVLLHQQYTSGDLLLGTNSTTNVTIKSGGNVGIGSPTPGYRLDVQGGQVNASGGFCIAGDCKTSWSQLGGGGSSQWADNSLGINYSGGNVGIGTASPGDKLEVNGNIRFTDNILGSLIKRADVVFNLIKTSRTDNTQVGQFRTNGWGDFTVDRSFGVGYDLSGTSYGAGSLFVAGALGVGTTSPTSWAALTVRTSAALSGKNVSASLSDGIHSTFDIRHPANNIVDLSSENSALTFSTASGSSTDGIERMRIDTSGNVGIGNNAPRAPLQFANATNTDQLILFDNGGNLGYGLGIDSTDLAIFGGTGGGVTFHSGNSTGTPLMRIVSNGTVGIGTTNPGQKLDVNGVIRSVGNSDLPSVLGGAVYITGGYASPDSGRFVFGDGSGWKMHFSKRTGGATSDLITFQDNGNITATGTIEAGNIKAKYQDVAEWVPSSEQLAAGTVVVLDSTKSNQVTSSSVSYDTRVAGVVSEQPGIALGEKSEGKVLVATTGRVRVKVDATKSPIHIGDLLVTSDVPGVAMKSEPVEFAGRKMHMPGTLIGKALEPLEKGKGEILVLLSLQ
jgi:hypothetical protein